MRRPAQTNGTVAMTNARSLETERQAPRYCLGMSSRLDKSWKVVASPSTPSVDRCVDIFVRPDGTFGFEEFRRDPEDMGAWTPVAYYSGSRYETEDEAVAAARNSVRWLAGVLDSQR
jgi:hypothetical protein